MKKLFPFLFLLWVLFSATRSDAADAWFLRGRVLRSTAQAEPGHFEVGLFLSVGADGLPVGYPIVQELLPEGRATFTLRVPARLTRGYLFAEFVSARDGHRRWISPPWNPWQRSHNRFAELWFGEGQGSAPPAASPAQDTWSLRGEVGTLFAPAGPGIPQEGVEVRVRGRGESARTGADGKFTLTLPRLRGTLALELLKPGYHPSVVAVKAGQAELRARIASRSAVEQAGRLLGTFQHAELGVFLGHSSLAGLSVRLSQGADGPFYFDDEGRPSRALSATSSDGRFLFLNVKPGAGFLESELGGEPVAPARVSTVEGGELALGEFVPLQGSVRGRLFDVISGQGALPLSGARVRLEGGAEFAATDAFGAFHLGPLKWMKGEKLSLLVSAGKFHTHRYQARVDEGKPLQLFAFPAAYLNRLAAAQGLELDPELGIVLGLTRGPAVRIDALADHAGVNLTKDFYFDARARMRPSPAKTDPRFGTFLLFNVPAGHIHLLGNDDAGRLRYSHSLFSGPSTVNVEVGEE